MGIEQTVLATFQITPPSSFQINPLSLVFMVIQFLVVVVVSAAMMILFNGKNKKRGKGKKSEGATSGASSFAATNISNLAQQPAASPSPQATGRQMMNTQTPRTTWQQPASSTTGPHSWQGWNTQTPPPAATRPPLPVQPQTSFPQKPPLAALPIKPSPGNPSQKLSAKWHWSSAGNTNLYPDGGSSSGPSISWGTPPPKPKR